MRFDVCEIEALKYALKDFDGDVYLFGSRLDDSKKGGDIDILLMPKKKVNHIRLFLDVQKDFF